MLIKKYKRIIAVIISIVILTIFCFSAHADNYDMVSYNDIEGNYYSYVKAFYRINTNTTERDDTNYLVAIVGDQGPTFTDLQYSTNATSGYYIDIYNFGLGVEQRNIPYGAVLVGINMYNTIKLQPDYTSGTKYSYFFINYLTNDNILRSCYEEVIDTYNYDDFLTYEGFKELEKQLQRYSSNESSTKPDYLIFSSKFARFLNRYTNCIIENYNTTTSNIVGDITCEFNQFVGGIDNLQAIVNFPDRYTQLMYRFRSNWNRDTLIFHQNASINYFTGYTDSRAQNLSEWWTSIFETGVYDWMPDPFIAIITSIMSVVLVVITLLIGKKIFL